jgi:hypothetical protein
MADRERQRASRYGRKLVKPYERLPGQKRYHKTHKERFRKYAVHAEGYEFIPALMHLSARYLSGVSEGSRTELDDRLARALDQIPEARDVLERAVSTHAEIPRELKRRVFSPRYLDRPVDEAIDVPELAGILNRGRSLTNRFVPGAVADIPSRVFEPFHPGKGEDRDCFCCPPSGTPDPQPPPPPPNDYELTFTKLYCVDESNPEVIDLLLGEINVSDEPYVVFGMITEEMAEIGTPAHAVHTPVYGDVDDGDTRPDSGDENLRIFGVTGARSIDSSVLITGSCFENDLGDPSDTTSAIRTALTSVATTAAGAGGVAGWVIAGAAVLAIGVTYIVDLVGADDGINGTVAISLTEGDADARTASVNPAILDPMHFDGGDDDGIYDAYLKLRRV